MSSTVLGSVGPAGDDPAGVAYRLVLPPGWVRLPMEAGAMRSQASTWLLSRYASLPRDRTATLRREIVQDLVALTRRAGAEYARMLLVLATDVQGRPVSASCLVSVVPHRLADETALQALAAEQGEGALEVVVGDLGRNRGVLIVRDEQARPPELRAADQRSVEEAAGAVVRTLGIVHDGPAEPWTPGTSRVVDAWLPVPDSPQTLLLSFATPLVPLFGPLTELFALIASSVQFQEPYGRWA